MTRFEAVTGSLLILAAVGVCANLAMRPSAPTRAYNTGDDIPTPEGVQYDAAELTLVLGLDSQCRYCTQSMGFYRRLLEARTDRARVQIVVVTPDSVDAGRRYVARHGVRPDALISQPLRRGGAVRILATPTILLVDRRGTLVRQWIGKLPPDREQQVLIAASL